MEQDKNEFFLKKRIIIIFTKVCEKVHKWIFERIDRFFFYSLDALWNSLAQKIIRNRIGKAEVKTCDRRKKMETRG